MSTDVKKQRIYKRHPFEKGRSEAESLFLGHGGLRYSPFDGPNLKEVQDDVKKIRRFWQTPFERLFDLDPKGPLRNISRLEAKAGMLTHVTKYAISEVVKDYFPGAYSAYEKLRNREED